MSEQEYLYIHGELPLVAEARLMSELLDLQLLTQVQDSSDATEVELTGRPRVSQGERVSVWVELNDRAIPDGPPDLVSASDDYAYEVYIRVFGGLAGQAAEARWIFDQLVEKRPDTQMLLTHEGTELIAAYLPGRGSHEFPPRTGLGLNHEALWRAWIPAAAPAPDAD